MSQKKKKVMQKLKECKKILIEVNQTCNLNCTYCFYRDYGRTSSCISLKNIEDMLKMCPNVKEFYLTGGECFTSKNIEEIIELLHKKGMVTVFTNGVILDSYDSLRLNNIVSKADRFIITFDSFDFENYICRNKLSKTLSTIKKIVEINSEKLEVKVCISKNNEEQLDNIFRNLIGLKVKYLSVNFIFDIKNSSILHEVKNKKDLKKIFGVIDRYQKYFNKDYIEVLKDLYLNDIENERFPCLADEEYFYLDCMNNYLICPGNCKKIGNRGDWLKCYSKECANEWEIMYRR